MPTHAERRAYWLEHVIAHAHSGLTQVNYCAKHGLNVGVLGRWRRRFHEQLAPTQASPPFEVVPTPSTPPAPEPPSTELRLELRDGRSLAFMSGTAPDYIAALVHAVEARC